MPKGKTRDEAMSNSEKIKPIALAIIELCFSEGIRQAVSQSVENSIEQFKYIFVATYWKYSMSY